MQLSNIQEKLVTDDVSHVPMLLPENEWHLENILYIVVTDDVSHAPMSCESRTSTRVEETSRGRC